MLKRLWPPFLAVLGYILALIALSGAGLVRSAGRIQTQITAAETSYRRVDDSLEDIRRGLLTVAIYLRDQLLYHTPETPGEVRAQQALIRQRLQKLGPDLSGRYASNLSRIQRETERYFISVDRMLAAPDPQFRAILNETRLQRQGVIRLVQDLTDLNERDFEERQREALNALDGLRTEIIQTIAMAILLSFAASIAALISISDLESRNRRAHQKTNQAREAMESLSRRLVTAQENERKSLSRELHDEIGQSLTALKLELAKCERLARSEQSAAIDHLKATREIADQALRATRSISLGLRPPMLDDLGLAAALNWFTREFSTRSNIGVDLEIEGEIANLPEVHRVCIYRIVQEALTNCARHAQATRVLVRLEAVGERLALLIEDNGKGFAAQSGHKFGLGLLSMHERAAELGGTLNVESEPGHGLRISARIPCPATTV